MPDDVELTQEQALEAIRKLFVPGIEQGFATSDDGTIKLSAAIDVLRNAFETTEFVDDPAGMKK